MAEQPERKELETARKLVMWSHILGWGGLGLLLVGAAVIGGLTGSITAGFIVAGLGGASAVIGAILGQVGRGLQGRVI